jgi:hypothetical protein
MMPFQLLAVDDDIDDEKKLLMIYRCQSVFQMLLMLLPSLSPDDVVEYPSC